MRSARRSSNACSVERREVTRAIHLLIALTVLAGAVLAASVKTTQDPKSVRKPTSPVAERAAASEAPSSAPRPAERAALPTTPTTPESGRQGGEGGHVAAAQGHGTKALEEAPGEAHADESPWTTVARLFNFALLLGILVYLLRSPFGAFLDNRKVQIRKDLTDAAGMRESAGRQLALIDQRLQALPGELEALKQRGAAEIVAEEARIRQAADVERRRMLDNAKREIDRRVQLAERRLLQRAGELAVNVATERVRSRITDADQSRLLDRYLDQVRPETMGS